MRWKREHYLAAFIPFFAYIAILLMVANDATDDVSDNIVLSIAASTSALSLMALNLFLSIRLRVSEKVFGGLDKQYFLHKFNGYSIVVFVFLHWFLGAKSRTGEFITGEQAKIGHWLGMVSFYLFLFLIIITIAKRLPKYIGKFLVIYNKDFVTYEKWRLMHKLMGVVFILVACHHSLVNPQLGVPFPETKTFWYVFYVSLFGTTSYLVSLCQGLFGHKKYIVTESKLLSTNVKKIKFAPKVRNNQLVKSGQFSFISFPEYTELNEPHPFTLSGVERDGSLSVIVKNKGNFTQQFVSNVKMGDIVNVSAPHGSFHFTSGKSNNQIWIAASIGITPFISWCSDICRREDLNVYLIHSVNRSEKETYLEELEEIKIKCANVRVIQHLTDGTDGKRLGIDMIRRYCGGDLRSTDLFFCGPKSMKSSLLRDMRKLNRPMSFNTEHFEFR